MQGAFPGSFDNAHSGDLVTRAPSEEHNSPHPPCLEIGVCSVVPIVLKLSGPPASAS